MKKLLVVCLTLTICFACGSPKPIETLPPTSTFIKQLSKVTNIPIAKLGVMKTIKLTRSQLEELYPNAVYLPAFPFPNGINIDIRDCVKACGWNTYPIITCDPRVKGGACKCDCSGVSTPSNPTSTLPTFERVRYYNCGEKFLLLLGVKTICRPCKDENGKERPCKAVLGPLEEGRLPRCECQD